MEKALVFSREDQELIRQFIRELVDGVVQKYASSIDFIILFGSVARGEFVKGASDIDLVIQLKDSNAASDVKAYATDLFWRLDEKYQTGFSRYLAIAKTNSVVEVLLRALERETQLYTPIFVFGPGELDWIRGKVLRKDLVAGASLIASPSTIFTKFQREGKVLFGRDIRKEMRVKLTWWERWKALWVPFYLAFFGFLILPFSRAAAVKYATKEVLWGVDSALVYLQRLIPQKTEQVEVLREMTTVDVELIRRTEDLARLELKLKYYLVPPSDFTIVEESLQYKLSGFRGSFGEALRYVLRVLRFLLRLNGATILRASMFSGKKRRSYTERTASE